MKVRKCVLCGYSTSQARQLMRHKMIHNGKKLYSCATCDFSSYAAENLKQHSYSLTTVAAVTTQALQLVL